MAARSRRRSTRDIYSSRLRHFASWCSGRDLDPTQAPLISVADFFMHLFRSGLQVTTIRNYRSAIAAIHQGFADGSSISSNDAIHHLFRGMFTQRPPVKRLIPSWDRPRFSVSWLVPPSSLSAVPHCYTSPSN